MLSSPAANVLLIHITGRDHPGLTHSLTSILAEYGVRVLDIGQAVIHDALALGILIELTDEVKSSQLLTNLLLKAHDLQVQVRFTAISAEEYDAWVRAQSKKRFIVTVLGPAITARHLASVSGLLAGNGLNIDRIDRLSGRTPLSAPESARVCVEFTVSGIPVHE